MTQLHPTDFYPFRENLLGSLERDLIGPSATDEVLDDAPITQYLSGILYPQGVLIDADQDLTNEIEGEEPSETSDPAVTLANVRYPSSMGLTCSVESDFSGSLIVQARAARYIQIDAQALDGEASDKR